MDGIAWVDGDGGRALLVPQRDDSLTLLTQLKLQVASRARSGGVRVDSVWHFSLADSAQTLGIAVPRCDLATCDGFVVGLIADGPAAAAGPWRHGRWLSPERLVAGPLDRRHGTGTTARTGAGASCDDVGR